MVTAILIVILSTQTHAAGDVIIRQYTSDIECIRDLDEFSTRHDFVRGGCIDAISGNTIESVG